MIHTTIKINLLFIFFIVLFSSTQKIHSTKENNNTLNSHCNKKDWTLLSLVTAGGLSYLSYYLLKNEYIKTPEFVSEHKNIISSLIVGLLTFGTVKYTLNYFSHKPTTEIINTEIINTNTQHINTTKIELKKKKIANNFSAILCD